MREMTFGEVIRNIRRQKGMTQEEVAEGICSVSSLSKMENGSQNPSSQKFQQIMERLGESGYSYARFFNEKDYERNRKKQMLLEALEFDRRDLAEELLWEFYREGTEDILEKQFLQGMQLFWQEKYLCPMKDYGKQCLEILQMTNLSFRPGGKAKEQPALSHMELLLLNNAGLGYFWEKQYPKAAEIFLQMYRMTKEMSHKETEWKKQKAAVCANLALVLMKLGRYQEAWDYLQRGMRCVECQGGVWLYLQMLYIRREWYLQMGEEHADQGRMTEVLLNGL